jgi:hypothetical protein
MKLETAIYNNFSVIVPPLVLSGLCLYGIAYNNYTNLSVLVFGIIICILWFNPAYFIGLDLKKELEGL